MRKLALLIPALVVLAAPSVASADATISPTVLTDDFTDNTVCSLREAVQVANTNNPAAEDACSVVGTLDASDTVQLAAGSYELDITAALPENGNATGDLDILSESLTLDGAGVTLTTIDTDDTPAFNDRVLHNFGASNTLAVSDLTITDGNAQLDAFGGGGILSTGPLTLTNARVTANSSSSTGGGIQANGNLTVNDSEISSNTVVDPGTGGGGISLQTVGTATIDDSVVKSNSVTRALGGVSGGGIDSLSSNLTITDSVLSGNSATTLDGTASASGGGLSLVGAPGGTVRGSTLSGNSVVVAGAGTRTGGGIRTSSTTFALINSTLSGNQALGGSGIGGGATFDGGTTATIAHTTFGPNPAGNATAIFHNGISTSVRGSLIETSGATPACIGTITSLDDNVVTDTSCFAETGNDDTDADPMLLSLADNGGADAGAPGMLEPLLTHIFPQGATQVDQVPSGDCLDHPAGSLTVDERGFGRPNDGDGNGTADCEAGALELQVPPRPTVTASTPASGADDNNPEIKGTAQAGTNVSLYTNGTCTSSLAGAGSAITFASPGITVTVPDNSTTTFFATATNSEGTSACSLTGLPYSEVTPPVLTPPPLTPPVTTGTPAPTATPPAKKCKKKKGAAAAKKCKRK